MKLGALCHNNATTRTGFVVDQHGDGFLVVWHGTNDNRPAYHFYDVNGLPLWDDNAISIDEWM